MTWRCRWCTTWRCRRRATKSDATVLSTSSRRQKFMNVEMATSPYSSPAFSFGASPSMADQPPKPPAIQLQIDDNIAQGLYTNLVMINHSENEFVFDFAYIQPNSPTAKVRAR